MSAHGIHASLLLLAAAAASGCDQSSCSNPAPSLDLVITIADAGTASMIRSIAVELTFPSSRGRMVYEAKSDLARGRTALRVVLDGMSAPSGALEVLVLAYNEPGASGANLAEGRATIALDRGGCLRGDVDLTSSTGESMDGGADTVSDTGLRSSNIQDQ
jgi:hypothetical protein